ncbi:MAG: 1-acyl-sn-glycerol-3-phosphate acyltransferase [Clostridia bacterium]|nr:1-acyl-sn-glycerol-3-phosphate acyltransferase [Clostridia bacterium]
MLGGDGLKHYKWHRFVWKLLTLIMRPYIVRRFNYEYDVVREKSPLLIVSNHVTDWDPFLVGLCFPQHTYFIASEHIFRWGLTSRLITWLVDPIARPKSVSGSTSVREILRRTKAGASVCLFAEGNRTWDGNTASFLSSTGKLSRISGAKLVTFRITGGYFTQPRWSKFARRGRLKGEVVGIYSPDQLKTMPPDEINDIISRDIAENAYVRQRNNPAAYKGKALAEELETCLCVCPACGGMGTLHSRGNDFFCDCGFYVEYGEDGFFHGKSVPFDSVEAWNEWQEDQLNRLVSQETASLAADEGVVLYELVSQRQSKKIGSGSLSLDREALRVCGRNFPLRELSGVSLIGRVRMSFTCGAKSFELCTYRPVCLKKYLTLLSALAASDGGLNHLLIT